MSLLTTGIVGKKRKCKLLSQSRKAVTVELILVSSALSQTPVYTAGLQGQVYRAVCLFTSQLLLVLTAPIPTEGWPG